MPGLETDGGAHPAPPDARSLEQRIAGLAALPIGSLRDAWPEAWGGPPPKGARGPAPHRPRRNRPRQRHLRHDPTEAPEDRRPRHTQRATRPDRHGLELPRRCRLPHRSRPIVRLIRNRPAPPFNATNQLTPGRAEGAGAQPYRFAAKHPNASINPAHVGLHEGSGEKCGLAQRCVSRMAAPPPTCWKLSASARPLRAR